MWEQIAADEESLVIVCGSIVALTAILVFGVGSMVVSLCKLAVHTRLKQHMLDRGMSAFEIEQVLKAGSEDSPVKAQNPPASRDTVPARPVKTPV